MQGGETSAGSVLFDTQGRIITVSGRKLDCWELQTAGWSPIPVPAPHPSLVFHQLANRWRRRECGCEDGKKSYRMISSAFLLICGCLNQSQGITFFPMCVCVCQGSFWWKSRIGSCKKVFYVFVYKACEMEEVRLCGGRWWECQGGWETASKAGKLTVLMHVGVCGCVSLHLWSRSTVATMISVLLLFTFQALQRGNQWVWWDQQGLLLLDLYKHHLLRLAESFLCSCAMEYKISKLYAQVVAKERKWAPSLTILFVGFGFSRYLYCFYNIW